MMRKVISLLLSIAMLITMVSVMATSASADTTSFTYTMDPGSRMVSAGTTNAPEGTYGATKYIEVSGNYVLRMATKGDQYSYFKLPADWATAAGDGYYPTSITFKMNRGADLSSFSFMDGYFATSIASNYSASGSNFKWASASSVTYANATNTYTLDLSNITSGATENYVYIGWKNKKDSGSADTAGIYIDDVTINFESYAEGRAEQAAPAAPTIASTTDNSVTLNAIENAQYSKDGVNWQKSATFSNLSMGTTYTFYARYKENAEYLPSPASEGVSYKTPAVVKWDLSADNFTLSNTSCGKFDNTYASDGTYFIGSGLSQGASTTFTSKVTVPAGVYSTSIFSRAYSVRAPINVDINGTRVATSLQTGASNPTGVSGTDVEIPMGSVTITEPSTIAMTITTTSTGALYLNSLRLEKTADYVVPVEDQYMGIIGETREAAQLRIGNVNGIRFITEVDTDLVAQAKADGYTVTMGTLIAPISFGELIEEKTDALNIPTTGYYNNIDGVIAGSIVNIKNSNIDKEFIARGYVTIKNDDVTVTFYSTQQHTGRSLKTLASAAMADEFYEHLNGVQQNLVSSWAYYGENV